ncbi:MAG: potassium-transporting ATPase subunit KdpC [Candidatus Omnitrophota bacterium]
MIDKIGNTIRASATEFKRALAVITVLTVLVGGIYPLMVWGIAQLLFPVNANGSFIADQTRPFVGSALIGQRFEGPEFFHSRPSASAYDALASGGSNLGPLSKALIFRIRQRATDYRKENGLPADRLIPIDAVTASASGLDPHISQANAMLQAARIARTRRVDRKKISELIDRYTEGREFGILGDPRVNVLRLNLELEKTQKTK